MSGLMTPEGPIVMRPPTEAEATAFEDKRRAHKAPKADDEQVVGGIYDSGLKELLACAVEPKAEVLDPDDGWLARWPGLFDAMAKDLRRLGGYHVALVDAPAAVKEPAHVAMGWRAKGYTYGGVDLVLRVLTFPEYNAFTAQLENDNLYALAVKMGKSHLLSHQGDGEADKLFAAHPYLAQALGIKLLNLAQGRAEAVEKK